MPRYRVIPGQVLPHHGAVLEPGAEVELPTHVAEDIEVAYRIAPIVPVATEPLSPIGTFWKPTGAEAPIKE